MSCSSGRTGDCFAARIYSMTWPREASPRCSRRAPRRSAAPGNDHSHGDNERTAFAVRSTPGSRDSARCRSCGRAQRGRALARTFDELGSICWTSSAITFAPLMTEITTRAPRRSAQRSRGPSDHLHARRVVRPSQMERRAAAPPIAHAAKARGPASRAGQQRLSRRNLHHRRRRTDSAAVMMASAVIPYLRSRSSGLPDSA